MQYRCSECRAAVVVLHDGGAPIKLCKHDAPITAEISSQLAGRGGVNDASKSQADR